MNLELWQITLLAVVQGITEFLPISSSAHLLLPAQLLDWPDQGLAFDVSVHVGTLLAVLVYFRVEVRRLAHSWLLSCLGRSTDHESRLAWLLILATVPAGLAGLTLNSAVEDYARSSVVIGSTSLIFAILLWWADHKAEHSRLLRQMTLRDALLIGLAQALALIPGTSRSGITMTAALLGGFTRAEAARFSFLLSIPIILASGLLKAQDLWSDTAVVPWPELLYAVALAAVVAYACIHYFLRLIERIGFMPFVVYRLLLGLLLLLIALWQTG